MIVRAALELEGMRRAGPLVARVLATMREAALPGVSGRELDALGARLLAEAGALSAPIATYDFPGATCISLNAVIAHGIPDDTRLRDGDLVNIDVSAELDGFHGDTGASFVVGTPTDAQHDLLDATREARDSAIAQLRAGVLVSSIGKAIEAVAKRRGYRVIRNLGSHGIGRSLHESPAQIPGVFDPRDRRVLTEGMAITVEPFLATEVDRVDTDADGWSLRCARGVGAQFEHTLVVTADGPVILT